MNTSEGTFRSLGGIQAVVHALYVCVIDLLRKPGSLGFDFDFSPPSRFFFPNLGNLSFNLRYRLLRSEECAWESKSQVRMLGDLLKALLWAL